ncbi:GNAT family N-acetyltransferase [Salinimicrobium tongyeongense]|jgi:GNAT superfamily N-acetyltransferase|uniref:GNAT family N-acetyltransferase n=1 Tax=Salinimicrobium tongyeongense TaxID=2809707 RepID=A0ABY6NM13_9FLAO|nr:GNAT family N-acetyltransferase [Salinimicrobium tongyeongense]UZH53930.1 GNAT family N-acetyltransferase [Salinimicrobium tongyeongense]
MIKPAKIEDLPKIKNLTEACALAMQKRGILQWNEFYPSLERLKNDILQGEMYLLEEEGNIEGIIVLTPAIDEEYIPVEWLTPNGNNLYVHRLATKPEKWGSGHGRRLMDFAEDFAKKQHCVSVRLDTFSENKRNQKFYEARGYKRLGNIYFPKQSESPFYCYEKILGSWR